MLGVNRIIRWVYNRYMAVRLSADWMTKADDRILEFLYVEGKSQPAMIGEDDRVRFKTQYINQRLSKLLDAGLVTRVGRGVYLISEEGEAYLSGEFDARDLDEPE